MAWTQKLKKLMDKLAQSQSQAAVDPAAGTTALIGDGLAPATGATAPIADGLDPAAAREAGLGGPVHPSELDEAAPDEAAPVESAETQAKRARQSADWHRRSELGGGPDPRFAPLSEALMTGMTATLQHENYTCSVAQELPKKAVVREIMTETRQRLDFSFQVTVKNLTVEKAVVETPQGRRLVSASTEEWGPPRKSITWQFLASMAVAVALYAMPFHRLARMVSSRFKRFKSVELTRHFQAVARHLVPLYLHLSLKLANAPVLSGDDTSSKVLEVIRGLEEKASGRDKPTPWARYATPERARQTRIEQEKARQAALEQREQVKRGHASQDAAIPKVPSPVSMAVLVAERLGFASERKDGTRDKVSFNTSVLVGRANRDDPKSTIIFYRSHLGSVGNLLDRILPHRTGPRRVVIQTDLSTTNLVHPDIAKDLDIQQAGCGAHARRPFILHKQMDPDICRPILHYFKGFTIYDRYLETTGRNETNTLAVRRVEHRQMWEDIRQACQLLQHRWSKKTELGRAAAYILRHYEKLTYYLNDAAVEWTNNVCERMLRLEKLISNSSYFRKSIEGRCALDIVRTLLQTAIAADVDPQAYLQWVLRMPAESIAADPAGFTPWAYAAFLADQADVAA